MGTVSGYGQFILGGVHETTWTPIVSGDVGSWLDASHLPEKTVIVYGTWGGATVVVQGANLDDKSDALTLADVQGNALSKTDNFCEKIQENPKYLRVNCTVGGATTSLTAKCVATV